ncbi:MAG: hypothetical protein LUE93_07610 [Bacteroides sp.]|nr:hypothetical protein [Bacteroides sp.]
MLTDLDYSLILPSVLLDYFDLVNVSASSKKILIYLEEKNNLPCDIASLYQSKDFYPTALGNVFPVRGKSFLLHIRRRRWIHKETDEYFSRDLSIIDRAPL